MTLEQWAQLSNRTIHKPGGTYVMSTKRNNIHHKKLWKLSDYKVTTVTGILVWLVPKETKNE